MTEQNEDLFYKEVEGRMADLQQKAPEKEKKTGAERLNTLFSLALGLVILLGLLFTLLRMVG
ncbi:accessory Sec system protein Asp4 [Streptococcus sp. DD13]|uniref:accessory Sec system protein Asp4 n=1 Tax=Streptococcus sp. DD13 TaxID=1777881 RepID=UPI000791ACCB|nr:accessory secretory system protein Asp4 [Streptococcus sp. DD13]KXT77741.1 hypothetical protein STRDD13_01421 [Streptococcus sp. DD13]